MAQVPTVLIVDDHAKNVKLLEAHLAATGVRTLSASDGEEALAIVREEMPDLVLLDVMMPKMDGFEVCSRMKEDEATRLIPVVMVTALDEVDDKVKGIEAGADDFLTKPVNRLELIARTKALLKTKQLNDQVISLQSALASLFEISTYTKDFADRQVLLSEFARRTANLIGAKSVTITTFEIDRYVIEASFNLTDEIRENELDNPHSPSREVIKLGKTVVVRLEERDKMEKLGLKEGYIGVPLISYTGQPFACIGAYGLGNSLNDQALHMLTIVAKRLGYELELKAYNTRLQGEVELRTSELQTALGYLKQANDNLNRAQEETIFRLAKAAEYRDEDTAAHLHRMSNYSYLLARKLKMEDTHCEQLRSAATMHDVGKIGIPDAILLKRGRFTKEEFTIMKEHTMIGQKILSGSSSEVLKISEKIALCHHEKFNGQGYPHGLDGESIPLEARIVAVADVFDALTTERVYKPAFTVDEALDIMKKDVGEHFDPTIFSKFLEILDNVLEIKAKFSDQSVYSEAK